MDLPNAVHAYFHADTGADPEMLARAFATEAVVEDEGARHRGREEIRAWWHAAKAKYRHTAEPLRVERTGDRVLVHAKVSGRFPNSPAMLDFAFRLEGDEIAHLRIG